MGAIEPLLGIVDMKNATGLVLASGEVPSLLPAGARSTLTMPALSAEMLNHLLSDLLTSVQRAALTNDGTLECFYESPQYGFYAIKGTSSADKLKLVLTKTAKRSTSESSNATTPLTSPTPTHRTEPAAARVAAPLVPQSNAIERSSETVARFDRALDQAIARRASDVLFSAGLIPWMRVDGRLSEFIGAPATPPSEIESYFDAHMTHEQRKLFGTTGSIDFAFEYESSVSGKTTRFRANLFRHRVGVAAALRPIRTEIPTLSDLHLPDTLTELVDQSHGLVLFTGATGSGKSTSLVSLLEHINQTRAAHIVTLEDPIEYAFVPSRAVIHQREVGTHVDSFASGLRAALRENPDVLLVGEMRDAETVRLALTAAQTGHLVLSTLHSGNAVMAIERIMDAFPEAEKSRVRQELAMTLKNIVAQQLVPAVGGGRVPALEILSVNHAIASQIRDGRTHMIATHLETGAEEGMVPMVRALANLVRSGRVAREVALSVAEDRATLEKLLEDRAGSRGRTGS